MNHDIIYLYNKNDETSWLVGNAKNILFLEKFPESNNTTTYYLDFQRGEETCN